MQGLINASPPHANDKIITGLLSGLSSSPTMAKALLLWKGMQMLKGCASLIGKRGLLSGLLLAAGHLFGQANQNIYTDAVQNGWQDWGWATLNYNNASPVHSGTKSISVTIADNSFQAIYMHHAPMSTTNYDSLRLWLHGGATGGQQLKVQALINNSAQTGTNLPALAANTWQQYSIPLSALGAANQTALTGLWIQDRIGAAQPTFYVDDVMLVTNSGPSATVALASPAIGESYFAPATISLAATVTTNGHTIDRVQFYNGASLLSEDLSPPYSFTWTNVGIGNYALTARVVFDSETSDSSPATVVVASNNTPAAITVNAALNRRAINPLIYGVAFASSSQLYELNASLNRWGGNTTTRYNWQLNADNRGNDWYYQSIGYNSATPGAEADAFIGSSKSGGAAPVITVPMIGWTTRLQPNRNKLWSFSITKYGPQTGSDSQWNPDSGNGISTTNSTPITWNDPNDASYPTNSDFQQGWIRHLTNAWGLSANSGVRYYCMDNEHTLWYSTHRDVHPVGPTMQEIRNKLFDYGAKVKAVDPNAQLLAPEEWGWPGYLYSGYDWQWAGDHSNWNPASFPDRATNGGWDYGPWLLNQSRLYEQTNGARLLDVFTYHIYPQGANESGSDVSNSTQLGRNRSTRALWDTNYVDQSWINSTIKLIPRMRDWVAAYYPGTKIGITEYNWGAEGHINGATAQADILGIFGREGLDIGTRWTTPDAASPAFKAMKLYRNYDGNKSTFGDTSIFAGGPSPDNIATFAAVRSTDGALTVMAINKQLSSNAPVSITLANFMPTGSAQVWRLTSANTIGRLSDRVLTGNILSNVLPAQSITLFVIPNGTPPNLRDARMASASSFSFWLDGLPGQRYAIQSSSNFVNWTALQTNLLSSNSLPISLPATNTHRFFRAQWVP